MVNVELMLDTVVALLGFVCPYSVCVLLSLSQVVVELSVWLVLNGAPRWHFEQPVQPRGTHCAHCPKRLPGLGAVWHMTCRGQAVRRCCSVSVLPLLSQFLPFMNHWFEWHFPIRAHWSRDVSVCRTWPDRLTATFHSCCFSYFFFPSPFGTKQRRLSVSAIGSSNTPVGKGRVVPHPELPDGVFLFETNKSREKSDVLKRAAARCFRNSHILKEEECNGNFTCVDLCTRDAPIPLWNCFKHNEQSKNTCIWVLVMQSARCRGAAENQFDLLSHFCTSILLLEQYSSICYSSWSFTAAQSQNFLVQTQI